MEKVRIGINGFGRIGRVAARIALLRDDVELVAINSRSEPSSHAYLLEYDSTHGRFELPVTATDHSLKIGKRTISCFRGDDPAAIPWADAQVDIVIEASGKFTAHEDAVKHRKGSVKKVLVSAPSTDADITIVMGVNEAEYDPNTHHIVSNASCTTNCTATVMKVLHDAFGIKRAMMTTVHAATQTQSILDGSSKKDPRGGRSVLNNIIPATTGASRAVEQVLPELKGKLSALSLRVPVDDGSIIDLVTEVEKPVTKELVNEAFGKAAREHLRDIIACADHELVSSDIIGSSYSAIIDTCLTAVQGETLVKVLAWYDNEWGYATRLIDLASYIGKKL